MKKVMLRLLACFAAISALAACQGTSEEDIEPQVLEISPSPVVIGALDTQFIVNVKCDLTWQPSLEDDSWAAVEVKERKEGGGSLLIKTTANTAELPRTNVLVIKAGKGLLRETITQEGLAGYFTPRNVTLVGTDPVPVTFKAPEKWKAAVVDGADWLRIDRYTGSAGNATLNISARDANEQVGDRTGSVRITIGTVSADISVLQGQRDCIFVTEDTALSFYFDPQELVLHTKYNVEYKVSTDVDWIVPGAKAPLYEAEESFSIAENTAPTERTGHINFTSEGHPDAALEVTVVQGGKDPIVNVTTPGLYGLQAVDYILGEGGWNQYAVLKGADASLRFRLLNQSDLGAIDVSGASSGDERDAAVTLQVRHVRQGGLLHLKKYNATVLYVKDGTTWYKLDNNLYFIAK